MAPTSTSSHRCFPCLAMLFACLALLWPVAAWPQSDSLVSFNDELEKVVKQVAPAVVEIEVTEQMEKDDEDESDDVDDNGVADVRPRSRSAVGSGVIVDSAGYIITNAHVVKNAKSLRVLLDKSIRSKYSRESENGAKSVLPAQVVGVFKEADLAVIKVDAKDLPTVPFAGQNALRPGQLVIAFGSPEGLEGSVTIGVISSAARQVTPDGHLLFVQTDAAINPGNSGGPLVDIRGTLVGINSFFFTQGGGSEGLSFAVPGKVVQFVYQSILRSGHLSWGNTGLRVQGITRPLAEGLHLQRESGVLVADVAPGTPAELADIKAGDVILSLDDKPVESVPDYYETLYHTKPGDKLTLSLLRARRVHRFELSTIAAREETKFKGPSKPMANLVSRLGVVCSELESRPRVEREQFRSRTGVLVEASSAGNKPVTDLAASDIIRSVNLLPVSNIKELQSALDKVIPGTPVVLQVERKSEFIFVAVSLD
jgi:serine protease Do